MEERMSRASSWTTALASSVARAYRRLGKRSGRHDSSDLSTGCGAAGVMIRPATLPADRAAWGAGLPTDGP